MLVVPKRSEYSEATAEVIDSEVREIINEQYARAVKILREKKDILEKGVKILLEKEKMEGEELKALLEEAPGGAKEGSA